MKKTFAFVAILASTAVLAACGDEKAGSTSAPKNTASASANTAAPAEATAGASTAAPAGDATNQNFTLNNRSQSTISHVYVSAVSTDNWEEDVLGQDVLAAGESVEIQFPREETACNWDIRVTIENDEHRELRNVNLCTTSEVVFEG